MTNDFRLKTQDLEQTPDPDNAGVGIGNKLSVLLVNPYLQMV